MHTGEEKSSQAKSRTAPGATGGGATRKASSRSALQGRVLRLQRLVGNSAVSGMLRCGPLPVQRVTTDQDTDAGDTTSAAPETSGDTKKGSTLYKEFVEYLETEKGLSDDDIKKQVEEAGLGASSVAKKLKKVDLKRENILGGTVDDYNKNALDELDAGYSTQFWQLPDGLLVVSGNDDDDTDFVQWIQQQKEASTGWIIKMSKGSLRVKGFGDSTVKLAKEEDGHQKKPDKDQFQAALRRVTAGVITYI